MKLFMERTWGISAINDERRQVLPSKVIWDGTINRFEVFRIMLKIIMDKLVLCIFYSCFQEAYLERVVDCHADFLDEVPSASQIKKGMLEISFAINNLVLYVWGLSIRDKLSQVNQIKIC
jgi:hypothetical protein